MGEFKKKFIDILFENDAIEDEDNSLQTAINEMKKTKKEASTIKAADVIYRKGSQSPFINLNEDKQISAKELFNETEEYKSTPKLSPIFGLINDNSKQALKPDISISESKSDKTLSHLDIVPSPIYGYGTKDDYFKSDYMASGTSFVDEEELIVEEEDREIEEDIPEDEDENITLFDDFGDLL